MKGLQRVAEHYHCAIILVGRRTEGTQRRAAQRPARSDHRVGEVGAVC